jgi:hypothetical protein
VKVSSRQEGFFQTFPHLICLRPIEKVYLPLESPLVEPNFVGEDLNLYLASE